MENKVNISANTLTINETIDSNEQYENNKQRG
jgi:hypothetical protein